MLESLWKIGFRFVLDALLYIYAFNQQQRKDNIKLMDKWKLKDWRREAKIKDRWGSPATTHKSWAYPV
ncbi:MAG: hypothetical protein DLM72_08225 [Candidatus Nitrosopolaris wilkensis]|nr:MAG: hypothetical protein DLM72_08225 [Candidatus Nitrosopolaris wilkensis]